MFIYFYYSCSKIAVNKCIEYLGRALVQLRFEMSTTNNPPSNQLCIAILLYYKTNENVMTTLSSVVI